MNILQTHANIRIHSDGHQTARLHPRWAPYVTTTDFSGDPRASQLSFRKNDHLKVDLNVPTANGWRWGATGRWGETGDDRRGWFPAWAAVPASPRRDTPHHLGQQQTQQTLAKEFPAKHHNQLQHPYARRRSSTRVAPLGCISEGQQQKQQQQQQPMGYLHEEVSGFDMSHNDVLGGGIPRDTAVVTEEFPTHTKAQIKQDGRSSPSYSWKDKLAALTTSTNPYTQKEAQPDWDGSEVPQIVSGDGNITVVGTNGHETSYRNAQHYQRTEDTRHVQAELAQTGQKTAEHLSKAGKTIETKLAKLRLPKPFRRRDSSGGTRSSSTKSSSSETAKKPKLGKLLPQMPSFPKSITKMGKRRSGSSELNIHY